jgi:hypothetical protein
VIDKLGCRTIDIPLSHWSFLRFWRAISRSSSCAHLNHQSQREQRVATGLLSIMSRRKIGMMRRIVGNDATDDLLIECLREASLSMPVAVGLYYEKIAGSDEGPAAADVESDVDQKDDTISAPESPRNNDNSSQHFEETSTHEDGSNELAQKVSQGLAEELDHVEVKHNVISGKLEMQPLEAETNAETEPECDAKSLTTITEVAGVEIETSNNRTETDAGADSETNAETESDSQCHPIRQSGAETVAVTVETTVQPELHHETIVALTVTNQETSESESQTPIESSSETCELDDPAKTCESVSGTVASDIKFCEKDIQDVRKQVTKIITANRGKPFTLQDLVSGLNLPPLDESHLHDILVRGNLSSSFVRDSGIVHHRLAEPFLFISSPTGLEFVDAPSNNTNTIQSSATPTRKRKTPTALSSTTPTAVRTSVQTTPSSRRRFKRPKFVSPLTSTSNASSKSSVSSSLTGVTPRSLKRGLGRRRRMVMLTPSPVSMMSGPATSARDATPSPRQRLVFGDSQSTDTTSKHKTLSTTQGKTAAAAKLSPEDSIRAKVNRALAMTTLAQKQGLSRVQALQQQVKLVQRQIADLHDQNMSNVEASNTDNLCSLISKWTAASQEIIQTLVSKVRKSRPDVSEHQMILDLLNCYGIEPDQVKYDLDSEMFDC